MLGPDLHRSPLLSVMLPAALRRMGGQSWAESGSEARNAWQRAGPELRGRPARALCSLSRLCDSVISDHSPRALLRPRSLTRPMSRFLSCPKTGSTIALRRRCSASACSLFSFLCMAAYRGLASLEPWRQQALFRRAECALERCRHRYRAPLNRAFHACSLDLGALGNVSLPGLS